MKIFYSGNTVIRPGDPVLIYGDGLAYVTSAKISRLDDETLLKLIQQSDRSAKQKGSTELRVYPIPVNCHSLF